METKTGKVKEVKPYGDGKLDENGNVSVIISFENGDSGFNKYRGSCKFVVGQEQEYIYEKKTSKAGKEYTTITVPKKPYSGGGGGSQVLSIEDYVLREKVKSVTFGMSYSKDLAVAGVIKVDEIGTYAKKCLDFMITQMDKLLKTK